MTKRDDDKVSQAGMKLHQEIFVCKFLSRLSFAFVCGLKLELHRVKFCT